MVYILSGQNNAISQKDFTVSNPPSNLSLPFFEDWSLGSFETNNWTVDSENWLINTEVGNDIPSAEFIYIPDSNQYYSYELESDIIDATELKVGRIMFQFEVKLEDSTGMSNEHLIAEVYNGENWVRVVTISNSNVEDWELHSTEITNKVLGKEFKIRFIAKGTNPTGSLSWFVDNISVYRICDASKNLAGFYYWNSNDDNGIEINWDVPQSAVNEWYNWIRWDSNINNSSLGLINEGSYSVAIRWDNNQLSDYDNDTMTAIRLFIADSGFSKVVAKIWTGYHAEDLIYYDTIENPLYNAWNEISIDTLLILDSSLEYWVGYRIIGQEAGINPIGYNDNYRSYPGYSDMISLDEDESIWDALGGWSSFISWNIQLKIIDFDTISKCIGFDIHRKLYNEDDYSIIYFVPNQEFVEHPVYYDKNIQEACYTVSTMWASEGDTCTSAFAESISQTGDSICVIFIGIQNQNTTSQFTIYPNPASTKLNIKGELKIREINIYNINDKKVISNTKSSREIDVSGLIPGLYIVELKLEDKTIQRYKLIVE